jgi:beta-mannosidase
MNEAANHKDAGPDIGELDPDLQPGAQLLAEARRLDPTRPTIKNSQHRDDLDSGDGHDYRGSLGKGHYLDIYASTEKLATEFGVDAPPAQAHAQLVPQIARRLLDVLPRVAELHDYQYHLIKYYIEHYRIQKYAPCSGYFQFMWIDLSPQSFYGLYDYWGNPKAQGIGGGLRALQESNMPVGVFMEYEQNGPVALHVANDLLTDLGTCQVRWVVSNSKDQTIAQGAHSVNVGPDSHQRVGDLRFPVEKSVEYRVFLTLHAADDRQIASNVYPNPFNPPPHPHGHPQRMDHEIGMRLWWAR